VDEDLKKRPTRMLYMLEVVLTLVMTATELMISAPLHPPGKTSNAFLFDVLLYQESLHK